MSPRGRHRTCLLVAALAVLGSSAPGEDFAPVRLEGTSARIDDVQRRLVPPQPGEGGRAEWITFADDAESAEVADEVAPVDLEPPPSFAPYVPHLGGPHTGTIPYAVPLFHDPGVLEREDPWQWGAVERLAHFVEWPHEPMADGFARLLRGHHDETPLHLSPCPIGLQPIVRRPPLLVEWGERFLAPGYLRRGITTKSCQVVRPALWVWGEYRSHLAWRENQPGRVAEWANRLDLFGQLNLTGTERLVVGLRPLDEQAGNGSRRDFAGYDFIDGTGNEGANLDVQTLFFEGDIGEILPFLSPYDFRPTDIGFSIGRQPLLAQQGLLLNEDRVDMVSLTRNTLNGSGVLNLRATAFYAWNEVNRDSTAPSVRGNFEDDRASMFGLLTEGDLADVTVNADAVYVNSVDPADSLWAFGLSAVHRVHLLHTTFNHSAHLLVSDPVGRETIHSGQGELLFNQFSWTPHGTEDVIYVNSYWAIDQFTAPARGPLMGGPVGTVGILHAHSGLGQYGPVISNRLSDTVGTAIGYQVFFDDTRRNVTVEFGARTDTDGVNRQILGTGVRYQHAIGQHWIWTIDAFVTKPEADGPATGTRSEILFRF